MSLLALWFRHRSSVLLLLTWPILYWAFRPSPVSAGELAAGVLFVASGAILRLTSIRHMGRGARVHSARARGGLTTTGPFRFVRNPLYVAAALVLVGFGLLAGGGWAAFALFPATILAYTPVVIHEEHCMCSQLGTEFEAYTRVVPRWVPGWKPLPERRGRSRAPWGEVLRREPFLIPGLWSGAGALLLIQLDLLPVHRVVAALPISTSAWGLALLAGAIGNSWSIAWKGHHRRNRRAQRAAPVDTNSSSVRIGTTLAGGPALVGHHHSEDSGDGLRRDQPLPAGSRTARI